MSTGTQIFSEREFYLAEFRGRSIGFAWPPGEVPASKVLEPLVAELVANQTRVVLLSARDDVFSIVGTEPAIDCGSDDYAPRVWRALGKGRSAGLRLPADGFEQACARVALELRLAKVVWIQSEPPVTRIRGSARVSVVDLAHLGPLLDDGTEADDSGYIARRECRPLLEAVRALIGGGIPSVNVCSAADLEKELLTYSGAGMFFTRDRYAEVRPLGLDDFDPASDLMARGEADGFLVPRDAATRDAVLAHGVGIFIEGRYLAGIGAILPYAEEQAAEVASLYALTRYVGEGAGGAIVRYAIDRARAEGLAYLFSCTTSERVEAFFVRHGFRVVEPDSLPKRKWESYAAERRSRVRCLRFDP
jgi:N-acetylglutamate synthase-like GNAT family acetyltransferase